MSYAYTLEKDEYFNENEIFVVHSSSIKKSSATSRFAVNITNRLEIKCD